MVGNDDSRRTRGAENPRRRLEIKFPSEPFRGGGQIGVFDLPKAGIFFRQGGRFGLKGGGAGRRIKSVQKIPQAEIKRLTFRGEHGHVGR